MESMLWDLAVNSYHIPLNLGLAVLGGGAVGWNRERSNHAAGLRTMMLVSLGAAAFAMAGLALSGDGSTAGLGSTSRVIQGIVGGIGFLGAGSIMRAGAHVKGVTTAAAIWATAGIGGAIGPGLYALGGTTGGLTVPIPWRSPSAQARSSLCPMTWARRPS